MRCPTKRTNALTTLVKTVLLSKSLWKSADGSVVCAPGKGGEYEREDAKTAVHLKDWCRQRAADIPARMDIKEIHDKLKARYQMPQDEWPSSLCSQFLGFKSQGGIDLRANKFTLLQQAHTVIPMKRHWVYPLAGSFRPCLSYIAETYLALCDGPGKFFHPPLLPGELPSDGATKASEQGSLHA